MKGFQYSCIFNFTIGFADSSHVFKGSALEWGEAPRRPMTISQAKLVEELGELIWAYLSAKTIALNVPRPGGLIWKCCHNNHQHD